MGYPSTFYYQIYVVDYKANYNKTILVTVKLNDKGAVKSVDAEFE